MKRYKPVEFPDMILGMVMAQLELAEPARFNQAKENHLLDAIAIDLQEKIVNLLEFAERQLPELPLTDEEFRREFNGDV
jgi:hypothetical protein